MMKTKFKEGDKFVLEIGNMIDEDGYEIVGTNLCVRTNQLRKLTPLAEERKLAVQTAYYKGFNDGIKKCTKQSERKKGKWLEWMKWTARSGYTFGSICSECGYITTVLPNHADEHCPGCGADMRGDE